MLPPTAVAVLQEEKKLRAASLWPVQFKRHREISKPHKGIDCLRDYKKPFPDIRQEYASSTRSSLGIIYQVRSENHCFLSVNSRNQSPGWPELNITGEKKENSSCTGHPNKRRIDLMFSVADPAFISLTHLTRTLWTIVLNGLWHDGQEAQALQLILLELPSHIKWDTFKTKHHWRRCSL